MRTTRFFVGADPRSRALLNLRHEAEAVGLRARLRTRAHRKLAQHGRDMVIDGSLGEKEPPR